MGICTNCNHYLVCHYYDKNAEECNHFQDKTKCVEVVRCKDCDHSIGDGWICGGADCVTMPSHPTYPDAFCSYGERKDNERKAD